ncbi:MAG: hypothetical protein KH369_15905 [Paraclostridium bifermentans]|uniref:hypothetical protein n=1 Tax=Paraclostridium bifermentans TaxID=1490 RepID=UPI001E159D8A|nr:hypothetical protein [Paraclostridium bifermentans]MBS6509686.1 hypothetical protein [Paraclostridium bifermentans]
MKEFKENMKVICMVDDYLNIKKGSVYTVESEIEKDYIFVKEAVGAIHKKDVKVIDQTWSKI